MFGRTPRDLIVEMIVTRAKRLLADTDLPMPDIARQCGLAYPERLAVIFSKETGKSPRDYRLQFRRSRV